MNLRALFAPGALTCPLNSPQQNVICYTRPLPANWRRPPDRPIDSCHHKNSSSVTCNYQTTTDLGFSGVVFLCYKQFTGKWCTRSHILRPHLGAVCAAAPLSAQIRANRVWGETIRNENERTNRREILPVRYTGNHSPHMLPAFMQQNWSDGKFAFALLCSESASWARFPTLRTLDIN